MSLLCRFMRGLTSRRTIQSLALSEEPNNSPPMRQYQLRLSSNRNVRLQSLTVWLRALANPTDRFLVLGHPDLSRRRLQKMEWSWRPVTLLSKKARSTNFLPAKSAVLAASRPLQSGGLFVWIRHRTKDLRHPPVTPRIVTDSTVSIPPHTGTTRS